MLNTCKSVPCDLCNSLWSSLVPGVQTLFQKSSRSWTVLCPTATCQALGWRQSDSLRLSFLTRASARRKLSPEVDKLGQPGPCVSPTSACTESNATFSVDKKNQLDVTFWILYFSSNSCPTCFGQPCAHHQELTTVWCYSLVLVCAVAAGRLSSPVGR